MQSYCSWSTTQFWSAPNQCPMCRRPVGRMPEKTRSRAGALTGAAATRASVALARDDELRLWLPDGVRRVVPGHDPRSDLLAVEASRGGEVEDLRDRGTGHHATDVELDPVRVHLEQRHRSLRLGRERDARADAARLGRANRADK